MIIVDAESRAKAVLISIQGKSPEVQLKVITGAIRGATEQAAQIADAFAKREHELNRTMGDWPAEDFEQIAEDIRATA